MFAIDMMTRGWKVSSSLTPTSYVLRNWVIEDTPIYLHDIERPDSIREVVTHVPKSLYSNQDRKEREREFPLPHPCRFPLTLTHLSLLPLSHTGNKGFLILVTSVLTMNIPNFSMWSKRIQDNLLSCLPQWLIQKSFMFKFIWIWYWSSPKSHE